ncbi:hypothetical protein PVN34_00930 [Bacillus thuringiensis]|uniref:hypothetical protein n=1 Tax=Bacillus thuringiensis TaxID=1428 RepID=UPI002378985D|nr:hypothetical protein [Bacillus thuringiensis]MDD9277117.1 hypothetical protein [Bacillus thuringiensis]
MENTLVHERSYDKNHCYLEAAIERFYDSLPDEWGEVVDDNIDRHSFIDGRYEADVLMENGINLKIEIYYAEEATAEEWVCKAYKVL